jgi:putative DNA primase/helicase
MVLGVPPELCELRQWVVWKPEQRAGKQTKVPYRVDGRGRASVTDTRSWGSFDEAVAADPTRVGFVFTAADRFCGVDIDNAIVDGAITRIGREIIRLLDSYTERSVSGTGLHVIVAARLDGARNRRGRVELYDRTRFFCVTGDHLAGTPRRVMPRQPQLEKLYASLFLPRAVIHLPVVREAASGDDEELLRRMFAAKNGGHVARLWRGDWSDYTSQSEADLALIGHLAYWTRDDPARIDALFRRSGLYRPKWERADYRERTITRAIRQ